MTLDKSNDDHNNDVQQSASNRVAEKWAKSDQIYIQNAFKVYWELAEVAARYQWSQMTGEEKLYECRDLLEYIASFFPKNKKLENMVGLVIGCNLGETSMPISLANTNAFKEIIVSDISKELLETQKKISDDLNLNHIIKYKSVDLNREFPSNKNGYDFIYSMGTIHHIQNLEKLFEEINKALKNDGLFAMREYIGPNYLQFTDKQVQIANLLLESLPDHMKRTMTGELKETAFRPTFDEVYNDDPSEAVRSNDIMDIVRDSLDILAENMTGGTILNPLMNDITENFDTGEEEKEILRHIINIENAMIQLGVIPSDYVFLIAKKV